MKAKKIMGIALLAFAIGQVSMAEKTDPNIERLLKIAKQKKAAEEKEARKQELLNAKYKNMSESEKMDVEIQRIKKRVNEINSNIETFHKTNEMLDKMEQRLEGIETKLK